jgi:DHA2 family methylenomycin A resistance protein-like MFS transporter
VLLSLGLIEADTLGWTSPALAVVFAVSVVLLAAFVAVERRVRSPLVDFALFRRRPYTGATLVGFAFNFALSALFFLAPLYFQELLGYSPLETGLLMLPLTCAVALALVPGRRLEARTDPRLPMLAGLAVTGVGLFLFSDLSPTTPYHNLWPALAIIGAGLGIALTPRNTVATNAAPAGEAGAATAVVTTINGLAAALAVSVSGTVFEELRSSRVDEPLSTSGVQVGTAARDAFAYAVGGSVRVSVVLVAAGLVVAAFVLRGGRLRAVTQR